ncbi:MAG: DUF1186 domain-containing protein [Gammaproteobacteria bacterium]
MTIEEILAKLDTYDYSTFQREALQAAILRQEAVTPALLSIIERIADNPQFLDENPDYMGFMYALYLLAQFREKRAYPFIVHYFAQLGTDIDALDATGDLVTEDLNRILASVCQGDLSLIKQLIEDPKHNEFVRSAALKSLLVLYNGGQLAREELITYFQTLIDDKLEQEEDPSFWGALVNCCSKIYPEELHDVLVDCFERELVDTDMINKDDLDHSMRLGKEQTLAKLKTNRHTQFIDDVISEMEWWACFDPEPPSTRSKTFPSAGFDFHRPTNNASKKTKIGRNDPCPCGSGKKYKKCCLQ